MATDNNPESLDELFKDLLQKLWVPQFEDRLSVEEALAHPWMKV